MAIFIHIRLRPGHDDDLAAWYEAQVDKSKAVRSLLRAGLKHKQEVALELRLPGMIKAMIHDALAGFKLHPAGEGEDSGGPENAVLGSKVDDLLSSFEGD